MENYEEYNGPSLPSHPHYNDHQELHLKNVSYQNDSDRIQANAEKGYILVAQFDGYEIYKQKNAAGGWTYWSDNCCVFSIVWDDCINSKEELLVIAKDVYNLELNEVNEKEQFETMCAVVVTTIVLIALGAYLWLIVTSLQ